MEHREDPTVKVVKRLNIIAVLMSLLTISLVVTKGCAQTITPINHTPTFRSTVTIHNAPINTGSSFNQLYTEPVNQAVRPSVEINTIQTNVPVRVIDVRVSQRHLVSDEKKFSTRAPLSPMFDPSKSIFYKE